VSVTIISYSISGHVVDQDGDTWARWVFRVSMDGREGVNTVLVPDEWAQDNYGVDANDPSLEYDLEEFLINNLEENPDGLGGIASVDGTPTDGSSSDSTDGTVVADGGSTDGSPSDGTASTDGSSSDGGDGDDHTGVIGEST
jgi:hypothetical protein